MQQTLMPSRPAKPALGSGELVCLVAALMALNALAIDVMLPGLPEIGHALGVQQENHRQWIITAYMVGFGVGHLAWGPLADRFGRRPVLIVSLVLALIFSTSVTLAGSFSWLIAARFLHGTVAAGGRVLAISIVRDCHSGRQMARVMSLAFIVFMIVPVVAPSIGQMILHVAPWRWVFGAISIWVGVVLAWVVLRLPETLHPEYRIAISPGRWLAASKTVLTERNSLGYTLAMSLISGALFGYVNSAQQIFFDVFKAPQVFPYAFGSIASAMAVTSFINSRIVERLGMRRVSHAALLGFVASTLVHMGITLSGHESLLAFIVFQALMMAFFGLAAANFGAMAMEHVGQVAGTASSLQGFINTVIGSALGFIIGQMLNGTTAPIVTGYAVLGLLALVMVLITERGRLFSPHLEPQRA